MPKLNIADFKDKAFDPVFDKWSSELPSSDYLYNTTLDPSLALDTLENLSQFNSVQDIFKVKNALGSFRQQQFLLYDVASVVGVPAGTVDVVSEGLRAFDVTIAAVQNADTLSDFAVLSTYFGAAGQLLSAIPTIYTQIAGAIVNFGVGIGGLIVQQKNKGKPTLPDSARPLQEFDSETDEYQFNQKVRTITGQIGGRDYTPLFSPRFAGQLTGQHRSSGGRVNAYAWGLGDGKVPKSSSKGVFNPTGGMGFVPGGRRITSLIQVMFTGTPLADLDKVGGLKSDTLYDPRCGDIATASLDVGEYYPGTSNGCLTIWDWANKLGQSMYTINASSLDAQWQAYVDSMWEGIAYYWNNSSYENWWGCSAWEGAVGDLARSMCVGINDTIGGFGAWSPSTINKGPITQADRDQWENQNIYAALIQRALWELRQRQLYYLQYTVIAAYLPSEGGVANATLMSGAANDPGVHAEFVAARKRILETQEKHWVRLDDVQDPAYAAAVEAAGGGWVPQHQGDVMAPGAPPEQPVPGIAIPPDAPPPPKPPNPGGGAPFGDIAAPFLPRPPEPSWLARYGPYLLGGVALAGAGYLGYRAYKRRKPNGLYLPPGVE